MAVTFVSIATTEETSNVNEIVATIPTHADGDILVAWFTCEDGDAVDGLGTPSGWTLHHAEKAASGNTGVAGALFTKTASSEGSTVTFSWDAADDGEAVAMIAAYRGATVGNTNFATGTSNAGAGNFPAVTAQGSGGLLVVVNGTDQGNNDGDNWDQAVNHRADADAGTFVSTNFGDIEHTGSDVTVSFTYPDDLEAWIEMKLDLYEAGDNPRPDAADLSLDGKVPSLSVSENRILEPGKADLALTRSAPSVSIEDETPDLSPAQADLVLDGKAPEVTFSIDHAITIPVGNLTLSPFTPSATLPAAAQSSARTVIAYNNLIDDAVVTGGAPTVSFPLINALNNPTSLQYLSTDEDADIFIDFRSPKSLQLFCLYNTTLRGPGTVQITLSNVSLGGDDVFDSGIVTIADVTDDFPHWYFVLNSEQTARFCTISIVNTGVDVVGAGRLWVGPAYIPTINESFGRGLGFVDKGRAGQSYGGNIIHETNRPIARQVLFTLEHNTEVETLQNMAALDTMNGTSKDVVVMLDRTNYPKELSLMGLVVRGSAVVRDDQESATKRLVIEERL